ncbi:MAG: hypothetical protein ACE5NW_18125 [Acidiferrobacterales bacterium]
MPEIDEELVQASWKETARFSAPEARSEIEALGNNQPDLLAFVSRYLDDVSAEAKELGVYLLLVIYRMFDKAGRKERKQVSAEQVSDAYNRNEALLMRLEGAHDRFYERAATASQPHVMKYLVDALTQFGEAPGDATLDEEEIATLFLVLKAAVDALDEATRGGRR